MTLYNPAHKAVCIIPATIHFYQCTEKVYMCMPFSITDVSRGECAQTSESRPLPSSLPYTHHLHYALFLTSAVPTSSKEQCLQSLCTNRGQAATPRMSLTLQNLFHSRRFSFRCLRRSQEAVRQRRAPLVNTWSENPCCTNCLRLLAIFLRDVEGRQKPQIFQSSDSDEKERNNCVFRVKNNWEMFNISKPS